jgi:HD-GYP domain-containing protein (c-di-GMP phosphodiesterase class II)
MNSKHRQNVDTNAAHAFNESILQTRRVMSAAILADLEARNEKLGLFGHSARVAEISDKIAQRFNLPAEGRVDLTNAARLHEAGMIAVPPDLIDSPDRLPPEVVARIRSQAYFSAEIARATQNDRTVRLIEEQYTEFRFLKARFHGNEEDILLASILHVVDAFDAVTFPRPYQQDIPDERRFEGLMLGQGTLFHPDVVDQLCELNFAA